MDIPYDGPLMLTSTSDDWALVSEQFQIVANTLDTDDVDIMILCAQISYTQSNLRNLSKSCTEGHEDIEPSCSMLITTETGAKELKASAWGQDNTTMTIWNGIFVTLTQ